MASLLNALGKSKLNPVAQVIERKGDYPHNAKNNL